MISQRSQGEKSGNNLKSSAEPGFVDFRESVKAIKENPVMAAEMLEVNLMSEVEVVDYQYSPTTMYEDYALNEYLFHWQSQNSQ